MLLSLSSSSSFCTSGCSFLLPLIFFYSKVLILTYALPLSERRLTDPKIRGRASHLVLFASCLERYFSVAFTSLEHLEKHNMWLSSDHI